MACEHGLAQQVPRLLNHSTEQYSSCAVAGAVRQVPLKHEYQRTKTWKVKKTSIQQAASFLSLQTSTQTVFRYESITVLIRPQDRRQQGGYSIVLVSLTAMSRHVFVAYMAS